MTAKVWTKSEIQFNIASDDRWLMRGLIAIFNRQTEEEKASEGTIESNGAGFNGVDAPFLSSLAEQYQRYGRLSKKQIEMARIRMMKYSGQLTRIANGGL